MKDKLFIIYDTEYWTDEGAHLRGYSGLNDYPPMLIQIAGHKVKKNRELQLLESFEILIQPKDEYGKNVPITPFFERLTNIKTEQIRKNGVELSEAIYKFKEFVGECQMYSYGNDMTDSIVTSCFIQGVPNPFPVNQSKDIRQLLRQTEMSDQEISELSSGRLARHFGIEVEAEEHNASFDAYSILLALRHLIKLGQFNENWL